MKCKLINDVTEYIYWNIEEGVYKFKGDIKIEPKNIYLQKIIEKKKGDIIQIPNLLELLNEKYPYINKPKNIVIENLVKKIRCIKEMVFASIKSRRNKKIELIENDCNNKEHISAAQRFLTELNSFCYKYSINKIFFDKIFLYIDNEISFFGNLDLILIGENKVYQIEIKTSRTNFIERYNAQLFWNKILLEGGKEIEINKSLILNIFEQQIFLELHKTSKKWEIELKGQLNFFRK